jgi:hypothetical protein
LLIYEFLNLIRIIVFVIQFLEESRRFDIFDTQIHHRLNVVALKNMFQIIIFDLLFTNN